MIQKLINSIKSCIKLYKISWNFDKCVIIKEVMSVKVLDEKDG